MGDLKLAKQSEICFGIKPRLNEWMSQISFGAGSCGLSDLNRGCVLDLGFVVWIELLDRDGIDSMMDTCWGTTDSKMA